MTTTDYLLDAALIFAVVRQLRGRRLVGFYTFLPFVIVAYVGVRYLRSIPTSGNSLTLVLFGLGTGLVLGVLCGLTTLVYPDGDGAPFVRATGVAAALWIVGVGARLAFQLYAEHDGGSLARFSAAHSLSMRAWVAALVLMALAEVVSRTVVLVVRSRRVVGGSGAAMMPAS